MIVDFIKNFKNRLSFLFLICIVVVVDQYSKFSIRGIIDGGTIVKILPFLNLSDTWNSGISFGFFQSFYAANYAFIVVNILIVCGLLFILFTVKRSNLFLASIALIIGGALGNLVDRFLFSAVYDFIDFHIYTYHWPTFNIADSVIFFGVMVHLRCLFE